VRAESGRKRSFAKEKEEVIPGTQSQPARGLEEGEGLGGGDSRLLLLLLEAPLAAIL
jgi:hypothetical protein